MITQVLGSLPLPWEIQTLILAPGFWLPPAPFQLLWVFNSDSADDLSVSVSLLL